MNDSSWIIVDLWTDVNLRSETFAAQIVELFGQRTDEFAPTIIYGGVLTQKRNVKFNSSEIGIIREAILNQDVFLLFLSNWDGKKRSFVFEFSINFAPDSTIIGFQVTHEFFTSEERKNKFISLEKRLIEITHPFYGLIDDMSTSLMSLNKAKEPHYGCVSEYAPTVYWGNYFGEKHIIKYGRDKLMNSPFGIVDEVGEGILLTLTPDPMDYNSSLRKREAKKLKEYLGIGKPGLLRQIFK